MKTPFSDFCAVHPNVPYTISLAYWNYRTVNGFLHAVREQPKETVTSALSELYRLTPEHAKTVYDNHYIANDTLGGDKP